MGSILVDNSELVQFEVGDPEDGRWVKLKQRLSLRDWDTIARLAAMDETVGTYCATLMVAIVEWNILGPDGEVLPLTLDNIGRVDPEEGVDIFVKISHLNPAKKALASMKKSMQS